MRLKNILFLFFAFGAFSCSSSKTTNTNDVVTDRVVTIPRRSFSPLVVIDPGHGGFDLGAHTSICEEKDACLKTAHHLRTLLEKRGYRVVMTRKRDEYLPLKTRAQIANDSKSQVLVSLHFNAAESVDAHGLEVYYFPKAESWRKKRSMQLAGILLKNIQTETGAFSRGVKEGNFCVIRETNMPAVLVEGGFITNEQEQRKIRDDRYLEKIALAIANGLDTYFEN